MSSQQAPKAAASKAHKLSSLSHLVLASLVLAFASSVASCPTQRLARDRTARRQDRAATRPSEGESRPERSIEMKSRRQSSGGSSAACAAGEGNTHTHSSGGGGCKLERKDVEKNRRLHMKSLCLKLSSLLPPAAMHASLLSDAAAAAAASNPNNKDSLTQLDSAAAYIKQLKERIEALKQRKAGGPGPAAGCAAAAAAAQASGVSSGGGGGVRMPVIEVRYQDGTLDVVLISDAGRPFKLHQVITVLEQEGAEVVSASFSVIGDKIFYTIHSQALSPRIGLDAARVSQRLHDLLLLAPILV